MSNNNSSSNSSIIGNPLGGWNYNYGGIYNTGPSVESLNELIKKQMKWVVKLNQQPDEELIKMIMSDPEIYDYIINPSEDVTNAYLLKEKL